MYHLCDHAEFQSFTLLSWIREVFSGTQVKNTNVTINADDMENVRRLSRDKQTWP